MMTELSFLAELFLYETIYYEESLGKQDKLYAHYMHNMRECNSNINYECQNIFFKHDLFKSISQRLMYDVYVMCLMLHIYLY